MTALGHSVCSYPLVLPSWDPAKEAFLFELFRFWNDVLLHSGDSRDSVLCEREFLTCTSYHSLKNKLEIDNFLQVLFVIVAQITLSPSQAYFLGALKGSLTTKYNQGNYVYCLSGASTNRSKVPFS